MVVVCSDGIIVRHDRPTGEASKVRITMSSDSVAALAPMFSEGFIHCPLETTGYEVGPHGPRIQLSVTNPTGERREIANQQLAVVAP
jgi:hypothetical protein